MKKYFLFIRDHIATIGFALGFVWDSATLTRIDLVYENVVFVFHLSLSLLAIFLVHAVATGKITWRPLVAARRWLPFFVQFPIGGLFSGFTIFYTKSASFATSWPFLLLLVAILVGNEFLHKRYERLIFQLTMWYAALFTYLVLIVPTVLGRVGAWTFVLAGVLSLVLVVIAIRLIIRLFPLVYERAGVRLWLAVGSVYVVLHVLYFAHIMPPVPLAIKDMGVYHSVVRTEEGYVAMGEPAAWWQFWRETDLVFHLFAGGSAYCYSAVFAPTRLQTDIQHVWQKKVDGAWVDRGTIPFSVTGGRDGGYRGYTINTNIDAGVWRCSVETARGQEIGRQVFTVLSVAESPALQVYRK
jgi:hypothetical protein